MDISESPLEAIVVIGEFFVIQSQGMKNCGMEIIDSGDLIDGFVSKIIRGTVGVGIFYSGSGEKCSEAIGIMVSP